MRCNDYDVDENENASAHFTIIVSVVKRNLTCGMVARQVKREERSLSSGVGSDSVGSRQ